MAIFMSKALPGVENKSMIKTMNEMPKSDATAKLFFLMRLL